MDDFTALSIAFLKCQPAGAARALALVSAEEAAAFVEDAPADLVAATLAWMQPGGAVPILEHCRPETTAALLSEMTGNAQAAVLRALPDAVRDAALATMPKRAAAAMRRLLSHSSGSIGAWMESAPATFRPETTVAECLERVRALHGRLGGIVYLTDADARLHGSLDIDDVLSADDGAALDSLPRRKVRSLKPQATLGSVLALPDWDTAWALPVVDRRRRLVGVLSFESLRQGLAADRGEDRGWHFNVLLLHVAQAFLVSLSGMLQVAATKHEFSRLTPDEEQ